jgi:hypothetical protein
MVKALVRIDEDDGAPDGKIIQFPGIEDDDPNKVVDLLAGAEKVDLSKIEDPKVRT